MRLQRAVWKSLSRLFGVYCMHLLLLTNADTCFLYSDPEAGMLGAGQDHKGTDDEWREECRALALSARAARAGGSLSICWAVFRRQGHCPWGKEVLRLPVF